MYFHKPLAFYRIAHSKSKVGFDMLNVIQYVIT